MCIEEIRRAILATPRERLDEIQAAMWKSWATGAVTDDQASELSALIRLRKAAPAPTPRRSGSKPRSDAHLARRRQWAASGWLPPAIASGFTPAEIAALSVVCVEVALQGRCELAVGALAGKAGVSESTVRNAIRQARSLGLLTVEERRLSYARSLPNVLCVVSAEWTAWIRFRGRGVAQRGWMQISAAQENTHISKKQKLERNREKGSRERLAPPSTMASQKTFKGALR